LAKGREITKHKRGVDREVALFKLWNVVKGEKKRGKFAAGSGGDVNQGGRRERGSLKDVSPQRATSRLTAGKKNEVAKGESLGRRDLIGQSL